MNLKFLHRIGALASLILVSQAFAFAQSFTQADLDQMVAELGRHAKKVDEFVYPIKASIKVDPVINAYASVETKEENGKVVAVKYGDKYQPIMVVQTGLIEHFKHDHRLIRAVVAHELAHLACGHPIAGGFVVGDINQIFTREKELQADSVGAMFLQSAGYSSKDMVDLLLGLQALPSQSPLLHRLGKSHPTGYDRAANVSNNPNVFRALAEFQLGNAFMENRMYAQALAAYKRAIEKQPEMKESYINAGQAALMHYYDSLPNRTRSLWFRPDFGAVLSDKIPATFAIQVSSEDLKRYQDALTQLTKAVTENPSDPRAKELFALAQMLDPQAQAATIRQGVQATEQLLSKASNDVEKLRLANNLGLGLHREGKLKDAILKMLSAQESTTRYSRILALNIGVSAEAEVTKETAKTAVSIVQTWLKNSPSAHESYPKMKATYAQLCKKFNFVEQDIAGNPLYLCQPTTLTVKDKSFNLFDPSATVFDALGKASKAWRFSEEFPNLLEYRWDSVDFHMLASNSRIFRMTTYQKGSEVTLKPRDDSVERSFVLRVGMTVDDLKKILNLDSAEELLFVRSGDVESWHYFPNLLLGVCIEDGTVIGLTLSPYEED
ncbi:tetratricopeptide repeat protein [Kamptonema cortianum]|nr:tetratricopeptide repeat protein [Geitlerinema splendidum]MDK3156208.1 tetratricopeptide repeat protein [Kamptonema cortianum]